MIDPIKLNGRLAEVWTSLGQDASAHGHEVMRACALTFIAVIDEDQESDAAVQVLTDLMREHPSRTILVRLAAGSDALLEADVDARCWMPLGGRRQICSEEIVIRASEGTLAEVPGVILPLIVPDLPVVLFCPSVRGWRSPAFSALAAPAGRLILDTFQAPRPLEALAAVLDQSHGQQALLTDLSWTRLTRWRALLAQVFENQLYRAQIRRFTEAVVYYEGTDASRLPPTCLLLAGWLASCLGWSAEQARTRLRFEHRPAGNPGGKLGGFALSVQEEPAVRVLIRRCGASCAELRVEMGRTEPVMNRVSLTPSDPVLLLSEELGLHAADPIFAESLECAVRLGRLLEA
jgi:glucose-6-phosphate dehydrogenase assembly protein OpcA